MFLVLIMELMVLSDLPRIACNKTNKIFLTLFEGFGLSCRSHYKNVVVYLLPSSMLVFRFLVHVIVFSVSLLLADW